MANIIQFADHAEKQIRVWVCECGCRTFELLSTLETVCAHCGARSKHEGGWAEYSGETVSDAESFKSVIGQDESLTRRRVLKKVERSDVVAIVSVHESGEVSTWTNVDGSAQLKWLVRRMIIAIKLIRGT